MLLSHVSVLRSTGHGWGVLMTPHKRQQCVLRVLVVEDVGGNCALPLLACQGNHRSTHHGIQAATSTNCFHGVSFSRNATPDLSGDY